MEKKYRARTSFACNNVKKIRFENLNKTEIEAMEGYFQGFLETGVVEEVTEENTLSLEEVLKKYNRPELMELAEKHKKNLLNDSMTKEVMLEKLMAFFGKKQKPKDPPKPTVREQLEKLNDEQLVAQGAKFSIALGDKTRNEMLNILEKFIAEQQKQK